MKWQEKYKNKLRTSEQIAAMIESGDTLTVNLCDVCPYPILDALADQMDRLENLTISGIGIARKPVRLYDPVYADRVRFVNMFFGAQERAAKAAGADISYQPLHLSRRGEDVAHGRKSRIFMSVASAPDENGRVSLSPNAVDIDLLDAFDLVIIQVNEKLPFIHGERGMLPLERADYIVEEAEEINYTPPSAPSEVESAIGARIAERIPDGACIQLGIGGLGTAIGQSLKEKHHLGIHTELFVDSMVDLIECGAVDNSRKAICPGKTEFGFALCSKKMADFLDDNPLAEGNPFSWINDPRIISQNDNVISINSAMEIDLTGQVAAENIGFRHFSGTGGQADFVRGSRWSRGGQSYICIPSVRKDKEGNLRSRISLHFQPGMAVTTPRADVQFIATEYGIVNLEYCTIKERAEKLISIAHPQFREELAFEAKKL